MRNKSFAYNTITEQEIEPFDDLLSVEHFQVLSLFARGYTYDQMAAFLSIPKSTVSTRLFRGRKALKKLLFMEEKEIKEMYDGTTA